MPLYMTAPVDSLSFKSHNINQNQMNYSLSRPHDRSAIEYAMSTVGLSLGFRNASVMENATVSFPKGSVTALIGPSGSGKTSFLRSLNRLNDNINGFWHQGSIIFDNQDIYSRSVDPLVLRRRVGMVFQRPNPFPMSIEANVICGVKAHKLARRSELHDIAETYLAEVGLWSAISHRLKDSPFRLSGGQQQLLCLARALAVQPDVLLLDEPTSSLDPRSTEAVEELIRRLVPSITIVIVTHNLAQARRLSEQTVFFSAGKLIEAGSTAEIFSNPVQKETHRYVAGTLENAL